MSVEVLREIVKMTGDVAGVIELLKTALSKAWDRQTQDFFLELLERVKARGEAGTLTERDLDEVEGLVRRYFGAGLAEVARRPVVQMVINSYLTGKQAVRADYYLNLKDERAIRILEDYSLLWVRDYYDRFVADLIRGELERYFEEGITRRELADRLYGVLHDRIREDRVTYFETLADHLANKIHNLGRVSGYEEAGIKYVKVVAVLDERTTRICRRMHGRVIAVKHLVRQRDRILRAARSGSISAMKRAQPMITEQEWERKYSRLYTTKDLVDAGLGLPPYHFRCRTRTVAYFESAREREMDRKLAGARGILRHLTGPEVVEWYDKTIELAGGKRLVFPGKRLLRSHFRKFEKHAMEVGARNEGEYLELAFKTIRGAKQVVLMEYSYRRMNQPQMWFFDGRNVVVVDRDYFIRTFYGLEENWESKIQGGVVIWQR